MDKAEKLQRRDISREYVRQQEIRESLNSHPMCDGESWMCDTCKRYARGCGLHPFRPDYTIDPMKASSTDSITCEGYL